MDAISEMSSGLSDAHPSESDLSDFIPTDLLPTNGDLIVVALMNRDRARMGADLTVAKPEATALAVSAPPVVAWLPSLVDRFEGLRPATQIALAALGAAIVVAGIGWAIGALGTKAAVGAAAAAL